MQIYPLTAFTYIFVFSMAFFFASMAQKSKLDKNISFYYILSLTTIILFCGLRFFVGNDYYDYYNIFQDVSRYNQSFFEQRWEPGIFILIQIFKNSKIGYFFFLLTCTIITYIFIFKALAHKNVLKWGVFFIFTLGLLIMVNDQVRQGVALSIFLFSIKYIEQKSFRNYIKWIFIASLFHYSALALIPIYFVNRLKLNSFIFSVLIITSYVGYQYGVFYKIIFSIIEQVPFYGEIYVAKKRFFEINNLGSGLSILFHSIIALFVALFYNKINKSIYATLFLYGSIIYIISVGFMPIQRFSYYLFFTNIIVLPIMFKNNLTKQLSKVLVIVCFFYFFIVSLYGFEKHGAVPYRTIFNENIVNPNYEYFKFN